MDYYFYLYDAVKKNNVSEVEDKRFHAVTFKLYKTWMIYIMPLIIIIGLINNITIILALRSKKVKLSRRLKIYYIIIAFLDLITILSSIAIYLEDGLAFTSRGNFHIQIRTINSYWCKTVVEIYEMASLSSNYVLASLCIERMVAIGFPLIAKVLMTYTPGHGFNLWHAFCPLLYLHSD